MLAHPCWFLTHDKICSYSSFPVRTVVQLQGQNQAEWVVYHRFSDFERFDAKLRQLVLDHLDQFALPSMVSKPWIPQPSASREFLLSRARKLTRYMVALVAVPELQQRVAYLEALLAFLSEGENWSGASSSAGASLLGKGIHAANSGLSKLVRLRDQKASLKFHLCKSWMRKTRQARRKTLITCRRCCASREFGPSSSSLLGRNCAWLCSAPPARASPRW